MNRVLVVDDDKNILKVIELRLLAEGYEVVTALDGEAAMALAREGVFDLALIDLKLDGMDGITLMEGLKKINPEMPIIILTAYGTIKTAVEAMRKGAFSYLTKPFEDHELLLQMKNCLEKSRLLKEVRSLRSMVEEKYTFRNIIGRSEKMQRVLDQVAKASRVDSIVHIQGESGTGKELVARSLHVASVRKGEPFVAVNCAAIPETLLESELFGYEKGAFTGATQSKKGLLASAGKGSFFLDEISEMTVTMQAKLLRVLEEKEFYPLGGGKTTKVDARIIVASNKDLEEQVARGLFREDLFYRIHVIFIKLPPLRERREDIPNLARHFLDKYVRKMNKEVRGFSPQALQKLMLHQWPGNVRELENTVESAVAMAIQDVIQEDLILPHQNLVREGLKPLKIAKNAFERDYLIQLIELTKGNMSKASKLAGKYRADLYELLKKHKLDPSDFRER